jgi:hypothetical protein
MNLRLVGVTIDEVETALKFSGLFIKGDTIRAIPEFLRDKKYTTLDMWEKIGDHINSQGKKRGKKK